MGRTEDNLNNWQTPRVGGGSDCVSERNRNNPNLESQVNWPTARTRRLCGGSGHKQMLVDSLGEEDGTEMFNGSKLNPSWVEQLQGLPVGWTQLSGATDPQQNRIERLRLLGNGVVPQTAEKAFRTLLDRI